MTVATVILTMASGAIVGLTLGLIGGGGSILATPLLLYVVGIHSPHVAIGTSAVAVSANAYANLVAHWRRGTVWWRCAAVFALIGTAGALVGASLGVLLDGRRLLLIFGIVMLVVGALMFRPRSETGDMSRPVDLRMCLATGSAAVIAGLASGFFGIGGGFLIVPALIFATGMPTMSAVGSSLLAVGTFGLATALSYASAGLVDWSLAGGLILGGVVGGSVGVALAARLSTRKAALGRIFAVLVIVVAIYMILRNLDSLVR
ncbi:sulfite exporter TauE/SafE family protein [Acetobacteraceae bacterium KSS8]|uniref:Probable membrane transporter protein n=1 Tax=Endosaccharibacter trunci TaxID=2812733 RepID=A0ABT1W8R0_9PROT|nr:sulfite exporter TauE/SafE family protein [Acetobacteraceae bacterium KSS8]